MLSLRVMRLLDCESGSRIPEPFRETSHQFPKFRPETAVENARSVRKNPQDSGLVKLRARKEFERQNVTFGFGPRKHEDRVPDGTRGLVPDSTK